VDAVALVEGGVTAYTVEEEGDESGPVFFRELGEDLKESVGVSGAHAWGDAHSGEEDLAGRVTDMDGVDDRLEVVAGTVNGDTAEAVVSAELEDENVGGLAQCPVEAAFSVGGCFTADAGVDDLVGQVEGVEAMPDEGRKSLAGVEAVGCGETVTKEDDGFSGVGGGSEAWACGCGMGTVG